MAVSNSWSIIAWDRPHLRGDVTRQIKHHFVHITPAPAFGRIIALDDGMLGAVEMLGGVLVLGRVATTDMAATAAKPQMQPDIVRCQALFATLGAWRHGMDGVEMAAKILRHHSAAAFCSCAARRLARKA